MYLRPKQRAIRNLFAIAFQFVHVFAIVAHIDRYGVCISAVGGIHFRVRALAV